MKTSWYELTGPRVVSLREDELTEGCGPSELVAATEFSVISPGTELAAWLGKPPLRPSKVYPRLVGYCNLACVIAIGSEVRDISVGDYILTHQSHRSHFRCARTEVLLSVRGLSVDDRRKLATTYLYHLGYVALLDGGYRPGSEVAIVGLGALGVTAASLTVAFGGSPLVLTSRSAAQTGACLPGALLLPKRLPEPGEWRSVAGLDGPDLIVNTSDGWVDFELSLRLVRRGGTIVLLGFPGRGEPPAHFNPLDSRYLYDKQLSIRQVGYATEGSVSPVDVRFTQLRNLQYLASLILRGLVNTDPFIRASFPWRDLADAYELLSRRPADAYSALLDWTC